jgi:23S rRNA (cytidine1920-2'-O)/16S rRNA (cytidine1409-2'-O)-methyltransferase
MKTRLDRLLVERGLADSREKAQALIMAGEVLVNRQKASKPGQSVADDAVVEVLARPPYVSRGGFKLAGAIERFGIDPAGKVCLDIGASTGGFTDVLLQAGAARVHAVDVGAGQLAWSIRTDPRVGLH